MYSLPHAPSLRWPFPISTSTGSRVTRGTKPPTDLRVASITVSKTAAGGSPSLSFTNQHTGAAAAPAGTLGHAGGVLPAGAGYAQPGVGHHVGGVNGGVHQAATNPAAPRMAPGTGRY
jgi:hypothetical protein